MALGIGALIGGLNGILVVRFEINAFIVTLASYIWGRGLVVAMSGGRSVYGLPDALRAMAIQRVFGIPLLAWVADRRLCRLLGSAEPRRRSGGTST